MASRRPRVLPAFLLLLFVFSVRALADAGAIDDVEVEEVAEIASPVNSKPYPELEKELERLGSRLASLESDIGEKARELIIKDDKILQLEKVIQEKSDKFASLQNEIDSLQLQKVSEEQKIEIRSLEKALKLSEEKMLKAQHHANSKIKSAWLPHWLAVHSAQFQSVAAKHWNEHGKPACDIATQKALETTAKVHDWAKPYIEEIYSKWVHVLQEKWVTLCTTVEPHLQTVSTRTVEKWVLVLQEKWVTLCTTVEPHLQTVSTRTVEVYEQSKTAITPHIVKAKEMADPYLNEAKKFAKPYVDRVATVTKPHVDKARVALKPHTKKVAHLYGEFLKSATTLHHQALETTAKVHDWAKPYIEEINSKWVLVLQEKWVILCTTVEPHLQTVSTRTVEAYEQSKTAITPHIVKAKEMADPYLNEAKKFAKSYVDRVATVTKPHVDKARVALKPHTKKVAHLYGEFLKSATTLHHQVQASVRRNLRQHELTRTVATDELVWFMASALLALQILLAYRFYCFLFCKKAQVPARNGNSSHTHRRPKRRYANK